MGEGERPYHRHLFTVRMWREQLGAGAAEWRGQVQYTSDGERRAFREWSELISFLTAKLLEIRNDEEA